MVVWRVQDSAVCKLSDAKELLREDDVCGVYVYIIGRA